MWREYGASTARVPREYRASTARVPPEYIASAYILMQNKFFHFFLKKNIKKPYFSIFSLLFQEIQWKII